MAALVFVHGTGVRRPAYDRTLALLREGVGALLPGARVHDCYWGDAHGAPAGAATAAVPPVRRPRARTAEPPPAARPEAPEDPEDEAPLLWNVLYTDPLAPLRLLGELADDDGRLVLGDRSGAEVARRARAVLAGPPPELAALLAADGREEAFTAALSAVLGSPACKAALDGPASGADTARALAVAAVARLLSDAEAAGDPVLWDVGQRDEAVRLLTQALGAQDRGLAGAGLLLADKLGLVRVLEKRRAGWLDGAAPQLGDVLRYLVRGQGLREFIAERVATVAAEEGPVVLLAHSLGGIAAVDLLASRPLPGVARLVTMGSQAPQLYAVDALPSLAAGEPLPLYFPPWTNLYDRRDPLAFLAGPVFPGRADDVDVTSGKPLLAAHSGYFTHPPVHALLADLLRGRG
ncbi:hypothetical protein [Streptomyces sp. 7-21]|uniref:hypothetical protein n=1 Tax=Streptomyces sp. 7-21 TaxID=2802283 RepID=UPI00191E2CA0|nr:hypothetical protein [Streptomyces sp. 7-21]MBL1068947.1 hypothetical protein [Streptomyces sp. 7-21]